MKIFIVGATGRVATELIRNLVSNEHQVIAGARKPENIVSLNQQVIPVKLDLHSSATEIAKIIGHVDVIYFTAGSKGKDLLQTDAFGAIKVMQAAEKNHIKRFIMLSSIFSLEPDKWHLKGLDGIPNYNIAKFFADNYLINNTNLDFTILQPTNLTEKVGTQEITIDNGQISENSIQNVALTLAAILNHNNTVKAVIKMRDGSTPIDQAIEDVEK